MGEKWGDLGYMGVVMVGCEDGWGSLAFFLFFVIY